MFCQISLFASSPVTVSPSALNLVEITEDLDAGGLVNSADRGQRVFADPDQLGYCGTACLVVGGVGLHGGGWWPLLLVRVGAYRVPIA